MPTKYRFLDDLDMSAFDGQSVRVEVSKSSIWLITRDGIEHKIATAIRERSRQAVAPRNGQPSDVPAPDRQE